PSRSPPTRARGLKPLAEVGDAKGCRVAPHAGAWIETSYYPPCPTTLSVAPHAGAWIETRSPGRASTPSCGSPPTRGRGLKLRLGGLVADLHQSPPTRGRGLKLFRQSREVQMLPSP